MYQQPASSTTAVIDLGAGWRQQPSERDHPGARTLLRPVAAAVAAVLVFALGGAVPGRRLQEVAVIALTPQGDFQVVGDLLLVRGADRLAGYGLTDGARRWDLPLPGISGGAMTPAMEAPGMVLTTMQDTATGRQTTYAVDTVAGVVRWQDELPMMALGDVAVAIWSPGEDRTDMRVTVRDVYTGQQRWSTQGVLPAIGFRGPGRSQDAMSVWTLQPGGELIERDLADGRVLRRHRPELGAAEPVDLNVLGDEVVVESVLDGVKKTARFATADLAPVALTAPFMIRTDCGAHWCTTTHPATEQTADDMLEIVDKATGEVRGRYATGSLVIPTPLGLLVAGPEPNGDGLEVVALLDPVTARPRADLTAWDFYQGSTVAVTVLLRGRGPRQVAWLAPDGLELTQLPVPPDRCVFAPRTIVCPAAADSVTLWRVTG